MHNSLSLNFCKFLISSLLTYSINNLLVRLWLLRVNNILSTFFSWVIMINTVNYVCMISYSGASANKDVSWWNCILQSHTNNDRCVSGQQSLPRLLSLYVSLLTAVSCVKGSFYMHTLGSAKAFLETHKRRIGG